MVWEAGKGLPRVSAGQRLGQPVPQPQDECKLDGLLLSPWSQVSLCQGESHSEAA